MYPLDHLILDRLTKPGPRLPWITQWLLDEVWSDERYETLSRAEYLKGGEETVNNFEILISAAADGVYNELLAGPAPEKNIFKQLADEKTAVVVIDGLSLRELPTIVKLAGVSGFTVTEKGCSLAAVPSETMDFIEREFACGRIGPSQLPGRGELTSRGITAIYTASPTQNLGTYDEKTSLLIWSAFPDNTYNDAGARFESHFEHIHLQFETLWTNTVQRIRNKKRIVITSDHGYVFFGTGMDFVRNLTEIRALNEYFGNNRSVRLSENPDYPKTNDIVVDEGKQVAMIKGRIRTRSTGEAATKLYRHGGLSLMEMFAPWIVLEI